MGFFGSTKISIIKKVSDGIIIAVTGAKAALKCELRSMEENADNMTYPMVMTLNGVPIIEMHPSYCPTCCGLLATGYGLDSADCKELTEISDKINSGFTDLEDVIDVLKPLIGLFEDGVYLIRDTQTFPVDGDGRFFWAVPDELKAFNAFTDVYFISDIMKCVELDGVFLYPTQSCDRYDENRVKHYMELFSKGVHKPRAIAYNAMGGMSALLDGHHKACAAARLHAPLDTILIIKGHLAGARENMHICFGYEIDPKRDIPFDRTINLPSKLYKQYSEQMERAFGGKKQSPPVLYKGLPVESRFSKRDWEKCYTESAYYYLYAYQLAAEKVFDFSAVEGMSVKEIYDYAFRQEDTVYFAQALMSRFVRMKDKRTKELLKEFTRLPFSGDSKQIIAASLRYMMNFKDEETERIFIDFAVCDDDYLANIAKDYWDDVE